MSINSWLTKNRNALFFRSANPASLERFEPFLPPASAEAQPAKGTQHVIAVAGKTRIDQDDAVTVGDQRPIHQVGLREVDAIGDGRDERCHEASVET